jgi:hypothetical protein
MRKWTVIPMAALLALAIAAPAAAAGGPNVSNLSGSAAIVNGEWYDEGSYGYAYFGSDSSYGAYGEFYEESGEWIPCDDTGETYGFVGSRTYGWTSDLAVDLDPRLNEATVAGTLELFGETINECTGEYDGGKGEYTNVSFSASLVGVGSVTRFRNSGSYHVPGDFNSHSKQSGKERQATGSIDLGDAGVREFDGAVLATVNWSDHSNN